MSSSRMWRRSSRRCAVMPSAPASIASQRRADRIGVRAAARVADGRDVVDVDAEPQRSHRIVLSPPPASARLPGLTAGIAASSGGSASAG